MKTAPELTEPRSFADALADIRFLQQRVATATRILLRRQGWRYTRLNPAHLWLWSKKFPDGRNVLTDLNTALAIESSLAHQPPAPTAATAAPLVPPLRKLARVLTPAKPSAPSPLPRTTG
jgi:hypothetical protein